MQTFVHNTLGTVHKLCRGVASIFSAGLGGALNFPLKVVGGQSNFLSMGGIKKDSLSRHTRRGCL